MLLLGLRAQQVWIEARGAWKDWQRLWWRVLECPAQELLLAPLLGPVSAELAAVLVVLRAEPPEPRRHRAQRAAPPGPHF